MSLRFIDRQRLEFQEKLTTVEVEGIALDPEVKVVQCSSPVTLQTWDLLNEFFLPYGPK
jgi:hypothetical protein